MKANLIALMLLLAMLLGIFGCAAPQSASVRDAIAERPSFIGESSDPLGAGGETSERPAQLLVQATDYSVPDKECTAATSNDSPCDLFRTIAFPTSQFRGTECCGGEPQPTSNQRGCGCGR